MKIKPTFRLSFHLASAIAALLASTPLHSASLTWDNGAATGNWNTTDLNWTGSTWNNATPDDAILDATGVGTVTLTEAITAGSLTINTAGYTVSTATFGLTLNTGITANEAATISGASGLTLGATNAWSVATTKTLAVSSVISGAFGITKTDAGTLTLSGTNIFSGQLSVQNGTLSTATANNVSANGPLGNSALPVILGNTGAQTGTLSYTGGTVTSTKPFTMASGGTGNFNVTAGGTSLTLSGAIDGGGALSKSGPGTLILTGASNSYSGGTIINAGTLTATTDAVLGNAAGGITFEASATMTPGSVTYARSVTVNNGAIASFNGANPTFSGNLTGTGGVANANGFGNQVNFTGTANSFEGQVRIGSTGVTGQAYRFQFSSLTDSASANGTIRFSASRVTHAEGSVFQYNGSSNLVLANRQIELASATGNPTNGHQIRSSGTGTLSVNTNLIVSGGCPQTLALRGSNTGANTFAGVISNSSVVGTTPLSAAFAAAAPTVTLASVQGITVGATISGTGIDVGTTITAIDPGTRVVTLSAATIGAGTVGQIMTVPGVLNPTSVLKTDAGYWTLSGNNIHTGGVSLGNTAGSRLNINHAGALGTGTFTIGAGNFDNTSGALITNANNNAIAWNGDSTFIGTNSLDLGTGPVTLGGNRNLVVSGNTLTMGGPVSGAFNITLGGGGTLVLTGASTFTGKVSIGNNVSSSLRLRVNSIGNLGAGSSALGNPTTVANGLIQIGNQSFGSTLEFTGLSANQPTDRQIQIGSNSNGSGSATIQNNDPTYTLTFSNSAFNVAATGITSTNRTLTLAGSNTGNNTISGTIINNVGTGGFGLVSVAKSGAGTWVLAGANAYTGATSINGGTLVVAHVDALATTSTVNISTATGAGTLRLATDAPVTAFNVAGSSSNPGTIVLDRTTAGAAVSQTLGNANFGVNTFNFVSGANVTSGTPGISFVDATLGGGVTGTTVLNPTTATLTLGTVTAINATPKTLNLGGTGAGHSISGAISDGVGIPVTLIKSDTSTWTLSGANTYTGNTTVDAGTLALADNAQLKFVLGATSGTNNSISGAGTVTLEGDFVIDTSAADALSAGSWTLENVTSLSGAYGPNFTVAGFTNAGSNKWTKPNGASTYTFDETTGILTLGAGSNTYASWIAGFPGVGLLNGVNDDPDNDGIDNGTEMVLGGNPATGMDTALLPTLELVTDPVSVPAIPAGNYMLFTYRRSDLSVAAGVTADCEIDTDLVAPWTPATGAPGVIIQVDDNFTFSPPAAADTDRVRVYVPRGANTKLFGRLNVVVP